MISAIVLSGGVGSRVGGNTKKQYIEILGKPVLAWALLAFEKSLVDEIVLVAGEEDIDYCKKEIIEKYKITKVAAVVAGGGERMYSVFNGLKAVHGEYVLIHDGARPCITSEKINEAIAFLKEKGNCVVGMPVTDTISVTDENGVIALSPERRLTWAAQTPQCFKRDEILPAYEKAVEQKDNNVTDDAGVLRKYSSSKVYMIPGTAGNMKLTRPQDVSLIERILKEEYNA